MQLLLNSNVRVDTTEEKPGLISGSVGLAAGQSVQITPLASSSLVKMVKTALVGRKESCNWLEQNVPFREFSGVSYKIHGTDYQDCAGKSGKFSQVSGKASRAQKVASFPCCCIPTFLGCKLAPFPPWKTK